jgi:methyltransferase (TIGR00027 family)
MERLATAAQTEGTPGARENPYITIRTRFFDDFFQQLDGARQIVLVAAGLDTRAYRLDWPAGTRLFELDRPEVLRAKQELLDGLGARPRCERITAGVDLAEPWGKALTGAGFEPAARSVWLAEGLFPYLDEAAALGVIAQISALATAGSRLATDIVGKSFLESPWTQPHLEAMKRENAPWQWGTDDPEGLLAAHGWQATAVRPGDEGANHGRWPYPPYPRGLKDLPNTYLVTAIRNG